VLGATVASLASTPDAISASAAPDLAIGEDRWDLVGLGVVSPTAGGQWLGVELAPGRAKHFTVRIGNRGASLATFRISGSPGRIPFTATYFTGDGTDVTGEVVSGTYELTLGSGARAFLYLDVAATADAETGARRTVRVEGATLDGSTLDRVAVRAEVPPIRVWGVNHRGTLRCDAEFPLRTLLPGRDTSARLALTNITDGKLRLTWPTGGLVLRDEAGAVLWDTRSLLLLRASPRHPFPGYLVLRSGRSVEIPVLETRIRWSGPIDVEPTCGLPRLPMPSVTLGVEAPGAPATVSGSIAAAIAEPGSPWQVCPPGPFGEPATGVLETPDGQDLPSLTLRCWASVRREEGFDVVSLHLVSPSDAPAYEIGEGTEIGWWEGLPGEANMLALRWSFVVTTEDARPYLSQMRARALGEGETVTYALSDGVWETWGWGPCGYESMGYAPTGEVLLLDWISGCSQTAATATEPARRLVRLPDGRTLTA